MKQFPAVVIGGPPHSGKSVLTYSLTQALRDQGIDHYVLRACPDGEGDWSNEAPPQTVRLIRNKGQFSQSFVAHVCESLANRHLPLLVDVGGRPTPEQEIIFDHCTHAILLSSDPVQLDWWRDLVERRGLIVIAELHSSLTADESIESRKPVLRGTITGLERHTRAKGPLFEALSQEVAALLTYEQDDLRLAHLSQAPLDWVVELDRLAKPLGLPADTWQWQPAQLPKVLDYLPGGWPLAIYGRGPTWLYAALAIHAAPAPLHQFDPRLGWIAPLAVQTTPDASPTLLEWRMVQPNDFHRLEVWIPNAYLDYSELPGLELPALPMQTGVVISGKIPHWLVTALARAYAEQAAWIAWYYPPLDNQAVVVASPRSGFSVGQLIYSPSVQG
jgi:CRISPR-associated protein Csx3